MLMITSIGANNVNSTKAAPAIPSSPTMNLRMACRIAVVLEIGVCRDIVVSVHKRDYAANRDLSPAAAGALVNRTASATKGWISKQRDRVGNKLKTCRAGTAGNWSPTK